MGAAFRESLGICLFVRPFPFHLKGRRNRDRDAGGQRQRLAAHSLRTSERAAPVSSLRLNHVGGRFQKLSRGDSAPPFFGGREKMAAAP